MIKTRPYPGDVRAKINEVQEFIDTLVSLRNMGIVTQSECTELLNRCVDILLKLYKVYVGISDEGD